jgi:hypothetical protein
MIIRSRWLTAALSLALLALFAAAPAHAKEPGTDSRISSGTFMWKNVGSGLCLEVSGSGGANPLLVRQNGTYLWLNYCNASHSHQWWTDGVKPVPGRPTVYSYTSSKSRMCMDTDGGKTAHGTVVVQGACTGSNSQYWLPNYVNAQNERNIVASFDTSKCLDTEYGKTNATVPVVIGQCTGSSTQKWLPIQVTDPTRFNKVNRVGVHNAYDKATASSLIDLLNTSPGMIEIDLNGRGDGKWDVHHGDGVGNNCSKGIRLEGCLSDIRKWHDQNPSHNPLVIKLEMKTDFVKKANTAAQLNAQLRKSLGVENVFTPSDQPF